MTDALVPEGFRKLDVRDDFVGLQQFERLLDNERWQLAIHNLAVYGVLYIAAAMLIGFLLAVFIDQNVTGEGVLRTVFLYPYAMSFVATGLVWQWVLNPDSGLQNAMQQLGWTNFQFDWIVDQDMVIYTLVIATVWQASGLVMAGLGLLVPQAWPWWRAGRRQTRLALGGIAAGSFLFVLLGTDPSADVLVHAAGFGFREAFDYGLHATTMDRLIVDPPARLAPFPDALAAMSAPVSPLLEMIL